MVDCNTLNLTRRGGRKGLAIGSGRGDRVELDMDICPGAAGFLVMPVRQYRQARSREAVA